MLQGSTQRAGEFGQLIPPPEFAPGPPAGATHELCVAMWFDLVLSNGLAGTDMLGLVAAIEELQRDRGPEDSVNLMTARQRDLGDLLDGPRGRSFGDASCCVGESAKTFLGGGARNWVAVEILKINDNLAATVKLMRPVFVFRDLLNQLLMLLKGAHHRIRPLQREVSQRRQSCQ
jgi:hypothetical protein